MNHDDIKKALEDMTKNIITKQNETFVDCLVKMFKDGILEIRETKLNSTTFDGKPVVVMSYGVVFRGQEVFDKQLKHLKDIGDLKPCSGCHETVDGHSDEWRGMGCPECEGTGLVKNYASEFGIQMRIDQLEKELKQEMAKVGNMMNCFNCDYELCKIEECDCEDWDHCKKTENCDECGPKLLKWKLKE